MKSGILIIIALSIMSLFTAPGMSHSDMMWKQEDTVVTDGETEILHQAIYLSGARFAIVSNDGLRMVLDMTDGTLSTIDLNEKSYFKTSLEEMAALRDRLTQQTDSIIEDALKNIPEDEREAFRKQIEASLSEMQEETVEEDLDNSRYTESGEKQKLLGYTTTLHIFDRDDRHEELWCTLDIDTSELAFIFNETKKIDMLKDINSGFSVLDYGFPLLSVIDDGTMKVTSKVTELSFDKIDSGIFTVPEGFTRVSEMSE